MDYVCRAGSHGEKISTSALRSNKPASIGPLIPASHGAAGLATFANALNLLFENLVFGVDDRVGGLAVPVFCIWPGGRRSADFAGTQSAIGCAC